MTIRIGTRESQLAVWQATHVQQLLHNNGFASELVYIKSEGDIDLQTPLYEIGVQGIFTRSLDMALLQNRIDIAVHSMKDVPTKLATGLQQFAVLERANYRDILVLNQQPEATLAQLGYSDGAWHTDRIDPAFAGLIATSSIRRKAQWLHRYRTHAVTNLRGNVNTRLQKVKESNWHGAIFAAAGLERIHLRPASAVDLDWMLPAPAQGAIVIVGRSADPANFEACLPLDHAPTALCTQIEKDFLRTLMGGCSTPISAHARILNDNLHFEGNIIDVDGSRKVSVERTVPTTDAGHLGVVAAEELLDNGGRSIAESIRHAGN